MSVDNILKWLGRFGKACGVFYLVVNLLYWSIILNDVNPEMVNDPALAHELGEKYQFDRFPFSKTKERAAQYFEQAIRLGNNQSYANLGQMILYGQIEALDYPKINDYAQKAFDSGFQSQANYLFGMIRLQQNSPFHNIDQAIEYLTISGNNGNQFAAGELLSYYLEKEGLSSDASYWLHKRLDDWDAQGFKEQDVFTRFMDLIKLSVQKFTEAKDYLTNSVQN